MRDVKKKYIMIHWKIIEKNISPSTVEQIISILLKNRNLTEEKDIKEFLEANTKKITLKSCGINEKEFSKFQERILKAINSNEKIIIFGDYDVDGICATAILWESLYSKSKNVIPYIPDRVDEGYGLSKKGIDNVLEKNPDTKVIITVDNGIVAYDAVDYATKKGIDVIVTDHHVKGKKEPVAFCLLHTTKLCGAGIAWVIARELGFESKANIEEKLVLATLATVADLVPLVAENRAIVKEGIEILKNTKRVGIQELLKEAGVDKQMIGVHTIGHVIAPRLNATGRIQSAMNALRLLCTKNLQKAQELSLMLGNINRDRQGLTEDSVEHAKLLAIENTLSTNITIVSHKSYNQGVIGLIASKLVDSYYRPAIAIAIGETVSKGSARSIQGVNIIELIRSVSHTIIEAGGHPMAAGFSLETARIEEFSKALAEQAEKVVTEELLKRYVRIDMQLPFSLITMDLINEISKLAPFGMGNPEPIFATDSVVVLEIRKIGKEQNHLKLKVEKDRIVFDAVGFGMADNVDAVSGDSVNIAYQISENEWNGKKSIQLKLKDIKQS